MTFAQFLFACTLLLESVDLKALLPLTFHVCVAHFQDGNEEEYNIEESSKATGRRDENIEASKRSGQTIRLSRSKP